MGNEDETDGRKGSILIVDDDPANLRLLVSMLTEQGYKVHPATGGGPALRFVQSTLPDLILLDVFMPGMDGYKVCEHLKADERTSDIPVIFISSADQVLDKVKAFSIGCVDYIVRPFQAEEVMARIGTHLSLRRLQKNLEERVEERTAELIQANTRLREEITERKHAEDALRESEARFRSILDNTTAVVYLLDMQERYIFVNRQWETLFHFSRDAVVGKSMYDIFPKEIADAFHAGNQAVLQSATAMEQEEIAPQDDGLHTYISLKFPLFDSTYAPYAICGISTDITGRKKAEALRDGQNQVLEMITMNASSEETLTRLTQLIESQHEGMLCSVLLLDEDGLRVRHGAAPSLPESYVKAIDGASIGPQAGSCGTAMYTGKPVIVTDILEDPLWDDYRHLATPHGLRACWSTPIVSRQGKMLGSFAMYYREVRSPSLAELQLIDIATHIARIAIERKQAEEALQRSEEQYRSLVENLNDVVFTVDAQGNLTYISSAIERMSGYRVEEITGRPFHLFVHRDDLPVLEASFAKTLAGQLEPSEFRVFDKNGTERWILTSSRPKFEQGRMTGITGILTDITERKKAEEALRQSEEEHRLFFELDLAGNYVSAPDGKLLKCNLAFARMFGFDTVEEAMELSPLSLDSNRQEREAFLDQLRNQRRLEYYEEDLRRRDGSLLHVIENAIGSFDEDGRLIEIRGYIIDDTERKKVEQQFRQSQRLEAIGRLAGGVAHDFNNMLTVILGYSEALLRRVARSDPMYEEVLEVKMAGERAASLTRQLLAFSRKQILQPKVLSLNEAVSNLNKMLQRLIGEDIDLITITDPAAGFIKADPGQIEQVIINLAVNARDAMPGGGRLMIETSNAYLDEDYAARHVGVRPGHYVVLAVSDNGEGMEAEVLSHIFEPFFTTKEAGKGTGLGLSTVYGIVKQSGGNVWAYSEPGRGTAFKIYLPRIDEAPDSLALAAQIDSLHRGTETVLLVEDETFVRRLATKVLQDAGYNVLEASNGKEALRMVAEQSERGIDLLVTDVVMPQMGGKELAEQVESAFPHIKVLFISGYTDDAIVHHGHLDAGVVLLQKPFTPSALARKVREVLDS